MKNPWQHSPDEIPANAGVNPRTRRLRMCGFCLWSLMIATGTVLFLFDPEKFSSEDGIALAGLAGVTILVAVLVGLIAAAIMRRLSVFGARLVGLGLFLIILFVIPLGLPWLTDQFSLFDQLPTGGSLSEQLPVDDPVSDIPFFD